MKSRTTQILATLLMWLMATTAQANDGVYYMTGNQLVPIQETDISVAKEVLTISLCDDGYALVDVQYEFRNNGKAKTVEMGFEASPPYNSDDAQIHKDGKHPYIYDFTVTLNGELLNYRNAVVNSDYDKDSDFKPIDLKKFDISKSESHALYDAKADDYVPFAYAYYFTAHFKEGINYVHHTYRYNMSFGVGRTFELSYKLSPAMRWANRQIDDFTLRIKADGTAKHFIIADSIFRSAPFKVTEGKGKIRKNNFNESTTYTEVALRNGTLEWHKLNFKPVDELEISSADIYTSFSEEAYPFGYFYDRSQTYVPSWSDKPVNKRILRNLPYAHRGYVFKDAKLKAYFNKLWWYMPDPQWKASTDDFTPSELKHLKGE